jgi:hypothetical protein
MVVAYNDIVNAIARAEDVALYNARSRAIELSNGCKPSKEDDDKAIEIESWIQLLTRAEENYDHDTCLTEDIIWNIIQNVNEQNRDVDCDVSRTFSRNASSGGGSNVPSGCVERVLGLYVNNTNPSLPIIEIFVDPLTISGDGTQADPFSAIGGATNLGYTPSPTDGTVTSSTGTDATLPLADGTNAGLLKPAKFTVLENENQAGGYVGTDANNEILSDYYIEQINVVTAQALVAGSDLVSLKAYIIDDADGGGRIIKVLAAGGVTNQFYQVAIDVTTSEIGSYDITTDVFTPVAGGSQTLAQTLILGNTSGAKDIQFDATQGLLFANASRVREGTTDAGLGGAKGVAMVCSLGYELKWEAGRLYVMEQNGVTIRQSLYNFGIIPSATDDEVNGYVVGSLWTLDDNTTYVCTVQTAGLAVWDLVVSGTVTSIATSGLISGGTITTSGTITTLMATNKLVGRYSASTGVMEEITIGSGLTLTGAGTLNNTATPTPLGYYGAFQDDTTQTAASINTAYPVKFNTIDLTNGVSVVNDGSSNPTRVTLANTGIYNIQFSLQLEKAGGSGNMIADIWIRKNGVDIPSTTGKVVLTGSASASPVIAAWNYVLDLTAGDYVQLMWSTSNTNVQIIAAGPTSPHPAIPSSILTVTQQSGIMAGTGITGLGKAGSIQTGAVQTLAVGTSGTDFDIVSSGNTQTFNIPTASASNRGALSSADWTAFNSKVSASSTDTLTNKRITARTGTVASAATPTINTDNVDFFSITGQLVDITNMSTNLSGTPTDAQTLWIAITGTAARAINWGTSFESSTITLPTTTVTTARLDVAFIYNIASGKWRCVGVA